MVLGIKTPALQSVVQCRVTRVAEWCLVIRRPQRLAGHLNVVEGTAKLHVVGIPLIHVEQVDPQAAGSPQQPRIVPDLGDDRHPPAQGLET